MPREYTPIRPYQIVTSVSEEERMQARILAAALRTTIGNLLRALLHEEYHRLPVSIKNTCALAMHGPGDIETLPEALGTITPNVEKDPA